MPILEPWFAGLTTHGKPIVSFTTSNGLPAVPSIQAFLSMVMYLGLLKPLFTIISFCTALSIPMDDAKIPEPLYGIW